MSESRTVRSVSRPSFSRTRVPDRMSVRVVDRLETVDVEQENGQRQVIPRRPRRLLPRGGAPGIGGCSIPMRWSVRFSVLERGNATNVAASSPARVSPIEKDETGPQEDITRRNDSRSEAPRPAAPPTGPRRSSCTRRRSGVSAPTRTYHLRRTSPAGQMRDQTPERRPAPQRERRRLRERVRSPEGSWHLLEGHRLDHRVTGRRRAPSPGPSDRCTRIIDPPCCGHGMLAA